MQTPVQLPFVLMPRRRLLAGLGVTLLSGCSLPSVSTGSGEVAGADEASIATLAKQSAIARYYWRNRGRAPAGFVQGMAVAYARARRGLASGEAGAVAMTGPLGATTQDALVWYAEIMAAAGGGAAGAEGRLRDVFALLLGLGMRESSGKTCEGRDMAADNTTAETAEAGLFQVSYNSRHASADLPRLIEAYQGRSDLLDQFSQGVSCGAASAENFGSGPGRDFQALTKTCPAFAVTYAGILLRHLRKHWGPLNRREAEVVSDSYAMLDAVRATMRG